MAGLDRLHYVHTYMWDVAFGKLSASNELPATTMYQQKSSLEQTAAETTETLTQASGTVDPTCYTTNNSNPIN